MAFNTIKKSAKILHRKYVEEDGGIVEMKAFQIPSSIQYPLGLKYSLFYIREKSVIVGYDNHFPKGPHKHLLGKEYPYQFNNLSILISDFEKDIAKIRKEFNDEG